MEGIKKTYEELVLENTELQLLVTELLGRVVLLEKQLGMTSSNSSKPPSSNGFKKVVQNNREVGKRSSGGQKGHKGHTLKLAEGKEISETHYLAVSGSCSCGTDLSVNGTVISFERRQEWKIPDLSPFITEYQVEKKSCCCGKVHKAACPIAYNIQYGSNVHAASVYFQHRQYIPVARAQEILSDLFGFRQISEGVILAGSEIAYSRLSDWEAEQIRLLQQAAVLHTDETGMEVEGTRQWAHVCSTSERTLYQYHASRGKEAHVSHDILPSFLGVLVHDRYGSYSSYPCQHSLCNAHLLRELKSLIEDKQAWATQMYALINEIYQGLHCNTSLEIAYQKIMEIGFADNPAPKRVNAKGKIAKTASLNLLECFRDRKKDILRFFYQENVPFDNNLAERDLRMFKLKQKISGTFRTIKGAKYFCRITSFISTLKKQQRNVWENLCALFNNPTQWAETL